MPDEVHDLIVAGRQVAVDAVAAWRAAARRRSTSPASISGCEAAADDFDFLLDRQAAEAHGLRRGDKDAQRSLRPHDRIGRNVGQNVANEVDFLGGQEARRAVS